MHRVCKCMYIKNNCDLKRKQFYNLLTAMRNRHMRVVILAKIQINFISDDMLLGLFELLWSLLLLVWISTGKGVFALRQKTFGA